MSAPLVVGRISFGATAPCRMCRGTGQSRNPLWGDKQAARERARIKRQGGDYEKPTAIVKCVECAGSGYLPTPAADSDLIGRDALRAGGV